MIFDAKITITMIFQIKEFSNAKIAITTILQVLKMKHTYTSSTAVHERILIISRDFDAKKKARVRYSEFKSTKHCESNLDKIMSSSSIIEIRIITKKISMIKSTTNLRFNSTSLYFRISLELIVQLSRLIVYIIEDLQDH